MNKQKRWRLGTAILILILLSTAWGCGPTPIPTLEPTVPPEEPGAPEPPGPPDIQAQCEEETWAGREEQAKVPAGLEASPYKDLMYVPGQVIVSGPRDQVEEVVEFLPLEESEDELEFDEGYVAQLCRIPDELLDQISVEEILCQIDKKAEELGFDVVGDPNYYLSPANEWAGAASPWTQNGEWIGEEAGGGRGTADADAFRRQWALGPQPGIGLYDDNGQGLDTERDGADVRVGIFDTSPFSDDMVADGEVGSEDLTAVTANDLSDAHQSLNLVVSHPPLPVIEDLNCPSRIDVRTGKDREVPDISSHGLFIAGLVHAVAPGSEIHLVRVLENEGCGSLFSIGKEVQAFMRQAQEDNIQNIVLNLSLGVHQPPNAEDLALHKEVRFLERMLLQASEQGAVIVAAAGNDSYTERDPMPVMELPAGYDFVIGVVASNAKGQRSCFSNFQPGDRNVAAPGGDGQHPESEEVQWYCTLPACKDTKDCLVSLSHQSDTGYVYWVGTSFAAPLVTGQVALNFGSSCLTPGTPWADPQLPAQGIIDLGASCP